MRPIVCPTAMNTNKDDFFLWACLLSQLCQPLVYQGLGLALEQKILLDVTNNALEQEQIVRVHTSEGADLEPCV